MIVMEVVSSQLNPECDPMRRSAPIDVTSDPKIAENRGRIVKPMGDGPLIDFTSVVDTIRRAVDVQWVRQPSLD
jgi:hypothetical protein